MCLYYGPKATMVLSYLWCCSCCWLRSLHTCPQCLLLGKRKTSWGRRTTPRITLCVCIRKTSAGHSTLYPRGQMSLSALKLSDPCKACPSRKCLICFCSYMVMTLPLWCPLMVLRSISCLKIVVTQFLIQNAGSVFFLKEKKVTSLNSKSFQALEMKDQVTLKMIMFQIVMMKIRTLLIFMNIFVYCYTPLIRIWIFFCSLLWT